MVKRNCYGLTTTPIHHPPVLLGAGQAQEGERGEVGTGVEKPGRYFLNFVLISHYPNLF